MADPIDVVNNEAAHRFEARVGDATAYAEYRLHDDTMILPHTVVPEEVSGRGVASQLAQAALGYAREEGLKVIPTCPFMAGYVARRPEWHDIIEPDCLAKLGLEAPIGDGA